MTTRRLSRSHVRIVVCDEADSTSLEQIKRAVSKLTRTCKVTLDMPTFGLTPKEEMRAIQRVRRYDHERRRLGFPTCVIFYHGRPNLSTILQVWHSVDDILIPSMSYYEVVDRICAAFVRVQRRHAVQHALQSMMHASDALLGGESDVSSAIVAKRSIALDIVVGFPQPYIYFRGRTSPQFAPKEMIVARMLIDTLNGDYVHMNDLEAALFDTPPTASPSRRSTVRRYVSRTWEKIKALLGGHVDLICRRGVGYKLRDMT